MLDEAGGPTGIFRIVSPSSSWYTEYSVYIIPQMFPPCANILAFFNMTSLSAVGCQILQHHVRVFEG
jgi:hypothetical protein